MTHALQINCLAIDACRQVDVTVRELIIAGFTGRNRQALENHIAELEKLGVPRPTSTPIFYRVAHSLLTTASEIQVLGDASSGEVEPLLCVANGRTWVGVGSDHTDRKLEAIGIAVSKQACAKPVGQDFWPLDEIADHWDQLVMRSFTINGADRELYQQGPLSLIRPPADLIRLFTRGADELQPGAVMYCGTVSVHGAIRPADGYEIEIEDPVLRRSIRHSYRVQTLRIAQ